MTARLYGVTEIAKAVGAKPNTVYQQYRRGKLPQPDAELAMGPVWMGRRIERWIEDTIAGAEARRQRDKERAPASSRGQTGRNA